MSRFEEVEVARIRANPEHIREDMGDLERLAKEIKTNGVRSPLVVYPHPELDGDFMLRDGHRRLKGAVIAGLLVVPVVVEEASARGALEDIETMITTGSTAKLNTKMEEAKGFQRLLDLGLNESTIGKRSNRPKSEVVTLGRVTKAPDKVKDAYSKGRIDLLQLKKLTDLQAAGQSEVLDKVLENHDFRTSAGWRIDNVEHTIARAEKQQAVADSISVLTALGGVQREDQRDENFDAAPEMTDEEHVAAGHLFYVGTDQVEPLWFVKLSKPKPKLSDKEREEKATLRELNAGLQVSHAVRVQELVVAVQSKDGVSEAVDKEMLLEVLWPEIQRFNDETLGALTSIHKPEGVSDYSPERRAWLEKVEAAVGRLSWRQLARAAVYAKHQDTDRQLRFTKNFDRSQQEWRARAGWLNKIQTHFGIRLYKAERETLAFFKAKGGDRTRWNMNTEAYETVVDDVVIHDG
ncbi:ParB N-terminal domain-containing protein [Arthrobacter sp. lap29]|uniref:ParB/RepB/Spo0J family partition protein n=1 Tax=Arthrobacter sp. lap29 TaxID=3056122 RepID=UPI0028F73060|nr:ParB N-terminal domain-containing protein [Arthrobacter sp. lap29]